VNRLKIAIIGQTGQLARALIREGEEIGHELIVLGREALDLSASATDIEAVIEALPVSTDAVILAAAYTAVDAAEDDRDTAFAVNATAPGAIARACARHNMALVHVSTDYVFAGDGDEPYMPEDETDPLGVYGASKLDGELSVVDSGARAAVLRTSWVFDGTGKNFMTTMLRLAESRDHLRVVDDQIGRPTYAGHLALACLRTAERLCADEFETEQQIFHVTGTGQAISWADFAVAIFRRAGLDEKMTVEAIPSSEYPTPAERPAYSVLETAEFEGVFNHPLPDWTKGLDAAFAEREG